MRGIGRWIAGYLALVGLPVIGIIGVLVAGRHLEAATPIDGGWTLQFQQPAHTACVTPGSADKLILRVQQSGRFIAARVRPANAPSGTGIPLDGTLDDDELIVHPSDTCEGQFEIRATVTKTQDGVFELRGTLSDTTCATCAARPFVGTPVTTTRTLIPEESR